MSRPSARLVEMREFIMFGLVQVMDELIKNNISMDLLTILTRVNNMVSKKFTGRDEWQVPEICSRLTKDLFFSKKHM